MLGVVDNGSDCDRRWRMGGVALSVCLVCNRGIAWLRGYLSGGACGD